MGCVEEWICKVETHILKNYTEYSSEMQRWKIWRVQRHRYEVSSKCQIWVSEGAIEEMREVQDLEEKFEENYWKTWVDRTDHSDLGNTKNSKWTKYKEIHTLA